MLTDRLVRADSTAAARADIRAAKSGRRPHRSTDKLSPIVSRARARLLRRVTDAAARRCAGAHNERVGEEHVLSGGGSARGRAKRRANVGKSEQNLPEEDSSKPS